MMNNRFDRIEARLRALFEENLSKLFTGQQRRLTLVDELIQVMQSNLQRDAEGQLFAPDLLILNVAQEEMIEWQVHQDILDEIANSTYQLGLNEGFRFHRPITIKPHPANNVSVGEFFITAQFSPLVANLPDTALMTRHEQFSSEDSIPENAMLIIGGKGNIPLDKPILNIGRHSENDLVLDDPHTSRHHAQIRVIKDHFVIFDVGSTGGLFLNGRRISQATLHAGDVIRIGTLNLIYNQEPTNAYPTSVMPVEDDQDFLEEDPL